jgi:V/A-type H+-transporting ATPase subunit E
MEKNIQLLTEKMFRDGVEKGQAEAERIVAEAKAQAETIIATARKEAEAAKTSAQKAADELNANTRSELKLYAVQTMNALKSEISTLITDSVVKESAKNIVSDKDVMGQFIIAMAKQFGDKGAVISTTDAEGLKAYFAKKAADLLNKGVTINEVNGQKTFFTIEPKDGSFKMNFGEEEFENFFKSFLRPQLVEMLFA